LSPASIGLRVPLGVFCTIVRLPDRAAATTSGGSMRSMPLDYNNVNSPYYSEAERTFAALQDWTAYGSTTLSVYFQGVWSNKPEDLYVAVVDSAGKTAVVVNPDPNAALATKWRQWQIPLSDLTAASINVGKVKKMYIGLGDRNQPAAGGTGRIYIDDICLIKP